MSRSALWRQEDNLKERERRATQIFATAIEEGRHNNSLRGIIPLHCPDDTFHIHPMLLQNITSSPYFQKCCEKLMDWNMVVDEIYYEVKHMEPWTAGEFCFIYYLLVLGGFDCLSSFIYLLTCLFSHSDEFLCFLPGKY